MKNRFILAALGFKQQLSQQTAAARSVLSQRYAILNFNFKVTYNLIFSYFLINLLN
jgi:hypothetical protein